MQTFTTRMISNNQAITYTVHDLYASINDIYAQFDDGVINYEEATEILSKCCSTFVDFVARQKATEKDREIARLKDALRWAKIQETQTKKALKAKKLLNIQQEPLTLAQIEVMIQLHASPSEEHSVAKGIPMQYLKAFQMHTKGMYRYKFRGQSIKEIEFKRKQSYITQDFATTFAIYKRKEG